MLTVVWIIIVLISWTGGFMAGIDFEGGDRMTAEEIIAKMESERKKQGLSCADMDAQTWHSSGCYSAMSVRLRSGGGMSLRNLMRYADILGLELAIRRKKEK